MRELLYGTRPLGELGPHAVAYDQSSDPSGQDAVTLRGVVLHYVLWEIPTQAGTANLPPSLHPTWPGLLSLQSWRVPASPAGPFTFTAVAIACRTSIKPRQLVVSAWSHSIR